MEREKELSLPLKKWCWLDPCLQDRAVSRFSEGAPWPRTVSAGRGKETSLSCRGFFRTGQAAAATSSCLPGVLSLPGVQTARALKDGERFPRTGRGQPFLSSPPWPAEVPEPLGTHESASEMSCLGVQADRGSCGPERRDPVGGTRLEAGRPQGRAPRGTWPGGYLATEAPGGSGWGERGSCPPWRCDSSSAAFCSATSTSSWKLLKSSPKSSGGVGGGVLNSPLVGLAASARASRAMVLPAAPSGALG